MMLLMLVKIGRQQCCEVIWWSLVVGVNYEGDQ